jgi:hypothetical protein
MLCRGRRRRPVPGSTARGCMTDRQPLIELVDLPRLSAPGGFRVIPASTRRPDLSPNSPPQSHLTQEERLL